ncbi:MAG: 30S ribosomal protein S21 [Fuerstiella sp.]|nr:30S ribosomal protein S21 [Fuerstiella sp.]
MPDRCNSNDRSRSAVNIVFHTDIVASGLASSRWQVTLDRSFSGVRRLSCAGSLSHFGGSLVVKLRLRDNENVNDAVKRFRKLVEHAGIKKEMRKREFFEKPSDEARRNRRRAQMRARRAQTQPVIGR